MARKKSRLSHLGARTVTVYNPLTGRDESFAHVLVRDRAVRAWQEQRCWCVADGQPNRPPDEDGPPVFRWSGRPEDADIAASFAPIVQDPATLLSLVLQPFAVRYLKSFVDPAHRSAPPSWTIPADGIPIVNGAAVGAVERLGRTYRACFAACIANDRVFPPEERVFARQHEAMGWLLDRLDPVPGEDHRVLVAGELWMRSRVAA